MKPTYEELLSGATRWMFSHKSGLSYELVFHGYREPSVDCREGHPGIWNYYLTVPEMMFPHRWDDFKCIRNKHGFFDPTDAWERVYFDSGISFCETTSVYARKEGRMVDVSKVGCDYSHLWNAEQGYPDTFASVKSDAERTVRDFLSKHPDGNARSGYSHRWDLPEKFYEAKNGAMVHRELDDIPDGWDSWKEKDE